MYLYVLYALAHLHEVIYPLSSTEQGGHGPKADHAGLPHHAMAAAPTPAPKVSASYSYNGRGFEILSLFHSKLHNHVATRYVQKTPSQAMALFRAVASMATSLGRAPHG